MTELNLHQAVGRFQKEWNEYEYARLRKQLAELQVEAYPYGIVNMRDKTFLWVTLDEPLIQNDYWQRKYEEVHTIEELIEPYKVDPEPIKFKLEQKQKYGDLYLGRPPHSWEKTDEDIIWAKWASVDLGSTDPDRRGGLMKYGGYGRAEPKKYLRGHLYPETIIKEGWIPKKHKAKVGKPYGDPLHGAKDKNGRLSDYGPEYYI